MVPPTDAQGQSVVSALVSVGMVVLVVWYQRRRLRRPRVAPAAVIARPVVEADHPLIPPRPAAVGNDEPVGRSTPIDHVRELLGPPPRSFDPKLADYLGVVAPDWLERRPNDDLWQAVRPQRRLRERGPVVWAVTVQANVLMFKPGPTDSPASVIYSHDPHFDAHPEDLQDIARDLFELKGTDQADPDAAVFARMLTLESVRGSLLRVPKRFTAGRDVYHASLLLPRKHLPRAYLTGNILPVWVDPDGSGAVLAVPAAYWPPSLLRYWQPPAQVPQPAKDKDA